MNISTSLWICCICLLCAIFLHVLYISGLCTFTGLFLAVYAAQVLWRIIILWKECRVCILGMRACDKVFPADGC